MRAILIDPKARTITEVECSKDYKQVYEFLSTPDHAVTTFDCVTFVDGPMYSDKFRSSHAETLFVDDEGLLHDGNELFSVMTSYGRMMLAGRGLILSTDHNGDSQAANLSLDLVRMLVDWVDLKVGQPGAPKPLLTFTPIIDGPETKQ